MEDYIGRFLIYLENDKMLAKNSLEAYRRDIRDFDCFMSDRGGAAVLPCKNDIEAYVNLLSECGKAKSTVNRKLASLRAFTGFLNSIGALKEDVMKGIKSPKMETRQIECLTERDIKKLLKGPDRSIKGIRDKAILELLCGTGMRVSEIADLKAGDVNIRMSVVVCQGDYGKYRRLPINEACREALFRYMTEVRATMAGANGQSISRAMKRGTGMSNSKEHYTEADYMSYTVDNPEGYLFMNYKGEQLSRQGLWKIIRQNASKAGINAHITPQILRNTFAVNMVGNGTDLASLQKLMGHEACLTTRVYVEYTRKTPL